jgi:hypothetical protein
MHDLLLVLGLLGHSGWVLGQEDELPGCSDTRADFLQTGCSDCTAAEETASQWRGSTNPLRKRYCLLASVLTSSGA